MGFLLIYLEPAFFCEVTEAWVYGDKWQRIVTMSAGIWSELIVCSLAAIVWWGTPAGTFAHNSAYILILFCGVLPVVVNLDPLIKLDGYFILTELLGIADLKENSTHFLTNAVKKYVFGLPVEVSYVRVSRRLLYVPYALLSGLYSYTLLTVVVVYVYHIARNFSPEWGFVPALLLAGLIFKSRILSLVRFMKTVYLDKKDLLRAWVVRPRVALAALFILVALFAPVWRETVQGRFLLEPARRAIVRAEVPGTVAELQ